MATLKNYERTLKDYVESLIAVCNLEKNTGCIDRSVFGGLDRLLSQWSLRESINPLLLIVKIISLINNSILSISFFVPSRCN